MRSTAVDRKAGGQVRPDLSIDQTEALTRSTSIRDYVDTANWETIYRPTAKPRSRSRGSCGCATRWLRLITHRHAEESTAQVLRRSRRRLPRTTRGTQARGVGAGLVEMTRKRPARASPHQPARRGRREGPAFVKTARLCVTRSSARFAEAGSSTSRNLGLRDQASSATATRSRRVGDSRADRQDVRLRTRRVPSDQYDVVRVSRPPTQPDDAAARADATAPALLRARTSGA